MGELFPGVGVSSRAAPRGAAADTTTPAGIAAAALSTIRALRDNALFVRIVELDPDLLLPYLISRRGRSQEALVGIMTAEIASGQASGAIRDGDAVLMARSLTLAGHGFVLSAQTMTDAEIGFAELDAEYARLITRTLEP